MQFQPYNPNNKAKNMDQRLFKNMWIWLEYAAALNWISPFFVQQVRHAFALKNWKLTDMVQYAMFMWESENVPDRLEYVQLKLCPNKKCCTEMFAPIDADHKKKKTAYLKQVFCRGCLLERYCSERCK
jgi:hypothetical protein